MQRVVTTKEARGQPLQVGSLPAFQPFELSYESQQRKPTGAGQRTIPIVAIGLAMQKVKRANVCRGTRTLPRSGGRFLQSDANHEPKGRLVGDGLHRAPLKQILKHIVIKYAII